MAARAKPAKPKGLNKTQLLGEIAGKTGLTKVQVGEVLAALGAVIGAELAGGRPATIPGLVKVTAQRKPATAARPGKNPFTGEDITIKAKPARNVVKVRALKALKDMV